MPYFVENPLELSKILNHLFPNGMPLLEDLAVRTEGFTLAKEMIENIDSVMTSLPQEVRDYYFGSVYEAVARYHLLTGDLGRAIKISSEALKIEERKPNSLSPDQLESFRSFLSRATPSLTAANLQAACQGDECQMVRTCDSVLGGG